MTAAKDILNTIANGNLSQLDLVQIFELSGYKAGVNTLQGVADQENISYQGVKKSKAIRKFNIGKAKLAVTGVDDIDLPY